MNNSTSSLAKKQVKSTFFRLDRQQLLWMYSSKIINNIAYVYLALKLENPFCDRPISISINEFIFAWRIPKSSLYAAVARLEELGALKLLDKKLVIQWEQDFEESNLEQVNSQQENTADNLDISHSQQGGLSRNLENILGSENAVQNPRQNSRILENELPKPLPNKDSSSSHTLQTLTDTSEKERLNAKEEEIPSGGEDLQDQERLSDEDLQNHFEAAKQGVKPPQKVIDHYRSTGRYWTNFVPLARQYNWDISTPFHVSEILEQLKAKKRKN